MVDAVAAINADYNGDGQVDTGDYTVWHNTLDETGDQLAADGNRDGVISEADFTFWKKNYGAAASWGAGGIATSVPEPNAVVLRLRHD